MATTIPRVAGKPRLVILGSGWGSFNLAKRVDPKLWDVHVVSPVGHMVFTPLLASTAVGTLEFRGIAEPVRSSIGAERVKFHLGKCRGIDVDAGTVRVRMNGDGDQSRAVRKGTIKGSTFDLDFDALVVGVGARNATFGVPGVQENVHFLKTLADARRIRKGLIECLEAAADPSLSEAERKRLAHFVVVGGGPTGVEFSSELRDFIDQDVRKHFPEVFPHVQVTLIEGKELLGSFHGSLREWTAKRFEQLDIEVRTGAVVSDVSGTTLYLKDGSQVPYGLCVWSTGVGPRKIVSTLSDRVFAKDGAGRLLTDASLRVRRAGVHDSGEDGGADGTTSTEHSLPVFPRIYALGDCANVDSRAYPPIAQVAERQAKWLAPQLNKLAAAAVADAAAGNAGAAGTWAGLDKPIETFEYKHFGSLAYVGRFGALTDFSASTDGRVPSTVRGKFFHGFASWLFWRSAYLSQLGAWRNKLQVPMDWTRTLIFGRDINNF